MQGQPFIGQVFSTWCKCCKVEKCLWALSEGQAIEVLRAGAGEMCEEEASWAEESGHM